MGILSGEAGGHIANLSPLIVEVMGASQTDINFDIKEDKMNLKVYWNFIPIVNTIKEVRKTLKIRKSSRIPRRTSCIYRF